MNPLLNLFYICFSYYFILPKLDKYSDGPNSPDPLIKKGIILGSALLLQVVFHSLTKIIKKKKITEDFKKLRDVSVMTSLLIFLGYLLVNDIKESPEMLGLVPGLDSIISSRLVTILFMVIPFIFMKTSKCFLKSYDL